MAEIRHRIDPLPEIRDKWCVGSRFGWLVVIDKLTNPSLLNPFTRSRVDLPPVSTLDDDDVVKPVCHPDGTVREYLYQPPSELLTPLHKPWSDTSWSLDLFRRCTINKIVLSSSPADGNSFVAMGLFSVPEILIYTRPGDNKWTSLNLNNYCQKGRPLDILYRQSDGKFLVLTHTNSVLEICFSSNNNIGSEITVKVITTKGLWQSYESYYLVDSDGDLLLVCREVGICREVKLRNGKGIKGEGRRNFMHKTTNVKVFRLNIHTTNWDPVKNLGYKAIFLGASHSVALPLHELPGTTKPNCIYFTDRWLAMMSNKNTVRDIGVYCLDNNRFQLIHPPDPKMTWPPPIWITPSF